MQARRKQIVFQPLADAPAQVDVPCESTEVTFDLCTTLKKMSCWLNRSHVYHSRRREGISGLDRELQTHDVIRRADREQREDHLPGSSYQPVGSVLSKRAGCGLAGEDASDRTQEEPKYSLAETRQRLEALDARRTSAPGFITDFVDESPFHRQKRKSMGDRDYDDRMLDGRRMAGDIQSPQYNPVSRDSSGLSVHSGAAAEGGWTCPSRVDTVDYSRGGYPHGFDRSRSHPLGPTEQMRSGMVSAGSAHDEYPSQNMWGEDWHGRPR